MCNVTKTKENGKYIYALDGRVYRKTTREFKYACVATTNKSKGALSDGEQFIIALGNKTESTYNSMARFFQHCDLRVVTIP